MTESLNVVMATTSYPRWDGDFAGHFVASLAEEIAQLGHRVTVVAPHAPGASLAEERSGVRVVRARYGPDAGERVAYGDGVLANLKRDPLAVARIPSLARALRRAVGAAAADADILHVHWAPTARLVAAGRVPAATVLTLHGSDVTVARRSAPFRALLRSALRDADAVDTVASDQARFVGEELGYAGPLEVIPSGVPLTLLEAPRRERLAGAPFTFAFVGRLIDGKGARDLLEAFAITGEAGRGRARLVFAGKGPLLEPLRDRVTLLGLTAAVDFLGEVAHERAIEVMRAADALVLPSYGEGSPLSVLEAMALGTPVIATSVGGVPELLGDTGRLLSPGDIGGLSDAMRAWVEAPAEAAALGVRARERAGRYYAWPAIAQRTLALYGEAIVAHARRGQ